MTAAAPSSTILLIDDSAHNRENLRIALESGGYQVLEAADPRPDGTYFRTAGP